MQVLLIAIGGMGAKLTDIHRDGEICRIL